MKNVAIILTSFAMLLSFGLHRADAQPADRGEGSMRPDYSMAGGACMPADDLRSSMGARGGMRMMGHMGMMTEDIMEARHRVMGMLMNLALDSKQKEAIHAIIERTAKNLILKRSDLLIGKIDLEDIIHKDPVDMRAAESQLKQIEAMKTNMFLTHLKAFEEIKATLTPEQRSKLKEMTEMHMAGGMMKGCDCSMMEKEKPQKNEKK